MISCLFNAVDWSFDQNDSSKFYQRRYFVDAIKNFRPIELVSPIWGFQKVKKASITVNYQYLSRWSALSVCSIATRESARCTRPCVCESVLYDCCRCLLAAWKYLWLLIQQWLISTDAVCSICLQMKLQMYMRVRWSNNHNIATKFGIISNAWYYHANDINPTRSVHTNLVLACDVSLPLRNTFVRWFATRLQQIERRA